MGSEVAGTVATARLARMVVLPCKSRGFSLDEVVRHKASLQQCADVSLALCSGGQRGPDSMNHDYGGFLGADTLDWATEPDMDLAGGIRANIQGSSPKRNTQMVDVGWARVFVDDGFHGLVGEYRGEVFVHGINITYFC